MTMTGRIGEVDFRKHPYRGLVTEVAEMFNTSKSAISTRIRKRDPIVLQVVMAKMRERERIVSRFEARTGGDA